MAMIPNGSYALTYIDTQSRQILNKHAQHEGFLETFTPANDPGHIDDMTETFNDDVESAAAAYTSDIDEMNLIHDLIFARIYQLLYGYRLTED